MNTGQQRKNGHNHDDALNGAEERAEPPGRSVKVLEEERVDDGEDPSVEEMKHVADDLRSIAVRGDHRAEDEGHVDPGQAECLTADGQCREDDRRGETPKQNGWKVHVLLRFPSMQYKQEVVVITGASAGVGRATARAFAKRQAKVGLIARGRDGLEAAKREIEAAGGEALVLPLDVSDHDAVENAAAAVESRFGPIDIWINNAMLSVFSPIMEMQPDEYRRVTDVTYLATVWGTLAALRRMKPRDRGAIVQVGSALAYRGIPLQSAYCAAKHAM